jgi:aryl-alcohol dehydrogenase-like predicted oxidoreductase
LFYSTLVACTELRALRAPYCPEVGRTLQLGDVEVTRIGLGTNRLEHTPAYVTFVKEAVAASVRLIDTAHTYTGGKSDETTGALSSIPAGCVVATKGG